MPKKAAVKENILGCPTDDEIATSVSFGAEMLKNMWSGDWFEKIDLPRLDLTDGIQCVLGQLFGSFVKGRRELNWSYEVCSYLGFYYDRPEGLTDKQYEKAFDNFYQVAQKCWIGEIADRLKGDKQ